MTSFKVLSCCGTQPYTYNIICLKDLTSHVLEA